MRRVNRHDRRFNALGKKKKGHGYDAPRKAESYRDWFSACDGIRVLGSFWGGGLGLMESSMKREQLPQRGGGCKASANKYVCHDCTSEVETRVPQ